MTKNNLAEKWRGDVRRKSVTFATSVRLRPEVDYLLQQALVEFSHLNQTQIINDALEESLSLVLSVSNSPVHISDVIKSIGIDGE